MSAGRVLIYVQHLLGIGHLRRAAALAGACVAADLEVTLVSGGRAVPALVPAGVHLIQLPPAVAADFSFRALLDEHGTPIDERWKRFRLDALLAAWRATRPHALVLELFPFGRRQMRFELLPLLEAAAAATPRPLIVSSVRDLLVAGKHKPERDAETLALLERYFDRVLVHGDPAVAEFARSFPHAARVGAKLHYTGYVVESAVERTTEGVGDVLVSAGGGAVGGRLLETAIRARPLSRLAGCRWRVLGGVNAAADELAALAALAAGTGDGQVVVERARGDFTALLANCAVSVSQGGYNTVMEGLRAGARCVVVPFAGGEENEQAARARLLAERGLLDVLDESALAPRSLAAAIDRAARRPRPATGAIDLNGAERSAALLRRWIGEPS